MAPSIPPSGSDNGRKPEYNGNLTAYVIWTVIIAASAGLLFGWDLGVTGGVTAFPAFQAKFFPSVLEDHADSGPYCKYDNQDVQWFTSSFFLAGAFSSLVGMFTTRYKGRRCSMMLGGFFFLLGAVLCCSAPRLLQLVFGRVMLGVGVGFANQSVPLYLSEVAPYNRRGVMNMCFQMATTIGILLAQLTNYGTQHMGGDSGWRLSLGLAAVPAVILLIGGYFLIESPNSLIQRGFLDEGRSTLQRIRGVQDVDAEYNDIKLASDQAAQVKNPYKSIFTKAYRPQLTIAVLVPAFQQLTGINSIMFYAPQIFQSLGDAQTWALLSTVIVGIFNVFATIIAMGFCDWFGRKVLFIGGGIQMGIAEVVVAGIVGSQFAGGATQLPPGLGKAVLVFIILFVIGFAYSWGPLGWLVPNEIQPLETRSAGQAIATTVNFLFSFGIGQGFLTMMCGMEYGVYLFFAGWVLIMTLFVTFCLPETKKVPIEEMQQRFAAHWLWTRYVTLPPPSDDPKLDP